MSVELILLEDVADLGVIGDRVKVANGYARNYLLPRKLGVPLSTANVRLLEAKKLRMQKEHEERIAVARALAEKIERSSVTLTVEANEENKLFGSVGPGQIADALRDEGIEIDRNTIQLEEPIRELGVFTVAIRLHSDVSTSVKVWVVRK